MTKRRIENVDLFVTNVAYVYVLNTRALLASTALSLILLLLSLFFLVLFVFICKCVQGLGYYLRLFVSVFEVSVAIPVYLQVVGCFV